MSKNCIVSVLVTFYNQKECVDRALHSILSQDFADGFEIVIGDDGSDDGTWEIVGRWVEKYPSIIRAYRMDRNDGIKDSIARASRNRIFITRQAHGEYIVYLDGDDYFPNSSKLQKQVGFLEKNESCCSCAHNFEYVDELGNRIGVGFPEKGWSTAISFKDYWSACYLPASCFMFRRPSFDLLGKADSSNYDDNTIVFLLAHAGDVFYFDDVMFSYVQREGSTWNSMNVVKRVLAGRRDYYYEQEVAPEKASSSKVRHSLEMIRLLAQSPKEMGGYSRLVTQYGLSTNGEFMLQWNMLLHAKGLSRVAFMISLVSASFLPACVKIGAYLRFRLRLS